MRARALQTSYSSDHDHDSLLLLLLLAVLLAYAMTMRAYIAICNSLGYFGGTERAGEYVANKISASPLLVSQDRYTATDSGCATSRVLIRPAPQAQEGKKDDRILLSSCFRQRGKPVSGGREGDRILL